ncbi:P-type conjugative transfer protein TrbG [Desulfovibrio sp. OttesenSCG-928-I05]|nr:P-type conjugative transfer protein TrbG [Desulfovibrio sp. OttesenSCG-928-O18]MDL2271414.1 P-type conjugative transfer protein TrbG [Desulfovibrio sp. OttesenSCG-928-I05]
MLQKTHCPGLALLGLVFLTAFLFLGVGPAQAAATPPGYPPALPESANKPVATPPLDFISPDAVELTDKERKALQLSEDWARRNIDPVLTPGGKIIYVHGATMPSVVASPFQICDVELEQGETVRDIFVGDTARWQVDSGSSGSGASLAVHVFIKPLDAGLETNCAITTDRRVYHLRFISKRKGHTPYVGFAYNDSIKQRQAWRTEQKAKSEHWQSTEIDGERADLSALNFNYAVSGKPKWKPERVYDDGRQIFIRLPESAKSTEMPVLLVRKGGKDVIVNYRVKDKAIIVDGIFDHIALILGVGGDQEKVEIKRGNK